MIRNTLFWTHLVVGIVTGVVVFVLCAPGAILTFEKQITNWAERDVRALPPSAGASWLSADALLASAAKVEPSGAVSVEWFADPKMPVRIRNKNQTFLLLNGWTGEVLGHGAGALRGFFRWNTDLHVSLLMGRTGDWIIGAANLCFCLPHPRRLVSLVAAALAGKALQNSVAFRLGLKGKARDWNWHDASGFWFMLPLLFIRLRHCLVLLAREPVVAQLCQHHLLAAAPNPPPAAPVAARPTLPDWNDLLRTVQQRYPAWRCIELGKMALPARHSTVALTVFMGEFGERFKAFTVTLDPASNTILKTTGWAEMEAGNRARAIARVGHTGELLGFWSQALALGGCLAGMVQVYTGFALSWRRFFGRKAPRPSLPA